MGKVIKFYNIRLRSVEVKDEEIIKLLTHIFDKEKSAFKVNASLGVLLRNIETVSLDLILLLNERLLINLFVE